MDGLDHSTENIAPLPKPQMPPMVILAMLILAAFMGVLIGGALVYAYSSWVGLELGAALSDLDENSPRHIRDFARITNIISHFFAFTVPALIVAMLLSRRQWLAFLKLEQHPPIYDLILGIFFILVSFPLAQFTYWLNKQIPLPDWIVQMETAAEGMIKSLLVMQSPAELLLNLVVMAVLPALGEELVFRGIVQQQFEKITKNGHLAVWITAIVFSAIHMQFQGFLPRLALGAVLGYTFFWTRNLWVPILAHFVINGIQVVAQYFAAEQLKKMDLDEANQAHWGSTLISLVLTIGIGYYLWLRNRTRITENDKL